MYERFLGVVIKEKDLQMTQFSIEMKAADGISENIELVPNVKMS